MTQRTSKTIIDVSPQQLEEMIHKGIGRALSSHLELFAQEGWLNKTQAARYLSVTTRTITNRVNEVQPILFQFCWLTTGLTKRRIFFPSLSHFCA